MNLKINRRQFLLGSGIGLTALTLAGGTNLYLEDEQMKRAPKKEGKILADLHTHPCNYKSQEETLEMLTAGHLVGLAWVNYPGAKTILTYEQALNLPGTQEIDLGILAKVTQRDKTGYFIKCEEFQQKGEFDIHLLALGCRKTLPKSITVKEAIKDIHQQGGLALLNHPYVTTDHQAKIIRYRLINKEEESKIEEIVSLVDEVEVFNAQNINPTCGIVVPNMKEANERAKVLAPLYKHQGTAASDSHRRLEQVGITGIYIPEENLCFEALKEYIKTKNFERYEQYVSKWSFVKGMFLS